MAEVTQYVETEEFKAEFETAPESAPCFHCETLLIYFGDKRAGFAMNRISDLPPVFYGLVSLVDAQMISVLGRPYKRFASFRESDQ